MPINESFEYLELTEFLSENEISNICNYDIFRKEINSGHIFQKYDFLMKVIESSINKFTEYKEVTFANLLKWVTKILKENLEIKEVTKSKTNKKIINEEEKNMQEGYLKEYSFGTKDNLISYILKKGLGKFVIRVGNKKYLDWKSLWSNKEWKKKQKELNTFTTELYEKSLLKNIEETYLNFLDRNYNIFNLMKRVGKENLLSVTCSSIYNSLGFFNMIDYKKFKNFIYKINEGYKDNLYHNTIHASDMVQTLYLYFSEANLYARLELLPFDRLSFFLAAAAHDLGHPGVNNSFLINSKDDIAITYNDQSVLENMHVSSCFHIILREPDCNIFYNLSKDEYNTCRKNMINYILSTDMCFHSKLSTFLKLKLGSYGIKKNTYSGVMFEGISEDVSYTLRQDFLNALIHSADISNPTKPWNIYKDWASRCVNEFFMQGDKEKKLGMAISFNCDRTTVSLPKSQIGFIDYIVYPYFECLVEYFPILSFLTDNIKANKENFNIVMKKVEEQKKKGYKKALCSC